MDCSLLVSYSLDLTYPFSHATCSKLFVPQMFWRYDAFIENGSESWRDSGLKAVSDYVIYSVHNVGRSILIVLWHSRRYVSLWRLHDQVRLLKLHSQ